MPPIDFAPLDSAVAAYKAAAQKIVDLVAEAAALEERTTNNAAELAAARQQANQARDQMRAAAVNTVTPDDVAR